jgi:hypothetical protein
MFGRRLAAIAGVLLATALAAILVLRLRRRPSLDSATRAELYQRAKTLNIKGRSRMNKRQLQSAVEAALKAG